MTSSTARVHWPVIVLAVTIGFGVVLTWISYGGRSSDVVEISLGFAPTQSEAARIVDEAVIQAVQNGSFGEELRLRLAKETFVANIQPFFVDICEVRQIDFESFAEWYMSTSVEANGKWVSDLRSTSSGHKITGRMQSPASGVNFNGAQMYCRAVGGRLPWAEEVEAMASGRESRLYPWGDEFIDSPWPYANVDRNAAQSCGSEPNAATPNGIQDLANNAMEWSMGLFVATGDRLKPAVHGAPVSQFANRSLYALNAAWLQIEPSVRSHQLGFRCVYDQVPVVATLWRHKSPKIIRVEGGDYALGLREDVRVARLATVIPYAQRSRFVQLASIDQSSRSIQVHRCEVSRGEYVRFLKDPLVSLRLYGNEQEPAEEDYIPLDWERQMQEPELPVVGLNWWSADAYARWSGGRLPSVEEWQSAAAGSQAWNYPWGDEHLNIENGKSGLQSCGGRDIDSTADGIRDMASNVSEWTRSIAVDRGGLAVWVQGGNWLLPGGESGRTMFGRKIPIEHRAETIGFRVVYD